MRKLPFGIYKLTIVERSEFSNNIPWFRGNTLRLILSFVA